MLALHESDRLAVPGRITLVDRGDALLGQFSGKAHQYAFEKLAEVGADVRLGTGVAAFHSDRVELTDGSVIPARTVVWGGGEEASRRLRSPRTPDHPQDAAVASTSDQTSPYPATPARTPWETWRTFHLVTTEGPFPS
jgi:NADH dehydrogenase FAD-containing subunit